MFPGIPAILFATLAPSFAPLPPNVDEIVARSVTNTQADWQRAPQFACDETDTVTKGGRTVTRSYCDLMIEGSPYQVTLAIDGKPLTEAAQEQQQKNLQREKQRRAHESPGVRQQRVAEYQKERRQDHALLLQMIKGFEYKLAGTENLNGHECYRIDASPRPGYVPPTRETRVLTGMRGTLWIDSNAYQWVKVTAAVFRPVAFGLFIAKVLPGTQFTLEAAPIANGLWLPTRFQTRVTARILIFPHDSAETDRFSNYSRLQ